MGHPITTRTRHFSSKKDALEYYGRILQTTPNGATLSPEECDDVKLAYFEANSKHGRAPCQDSGVRLRWEELVVDHRLPNSFSVIVDRFIEIHGLTITDIEYDRVFGGPNPFTDSKLAETFRDYHGQKARLRIVARDRNLSRAHHARVKRVAGDLTVARFDTPQSDAAGDGKSLGAEAE